MYLRSVSSQETSLVSLKAQISLISYLSLSTPSCLSFFIFLLLQLLRTLFACDFPDRVDTRAHEHNAFGFIDGCFT